MSNNENVIREKRTNQAMKKNYMGPSGKFGLILEAFGTPIIRQGSGLNDVNFLDYGDDYTYTEYESVMSEQKGPVRYRDEILDANDDYTEMEGTLFDGLSRGLHYEIKYWELENEIVVSYKGYVVYHEIAGELHGFVPMKDWEIITERLHKAAKAKLKEMKSHEEAYIAEEVEKRKHGFWQNLIRKWGVS